MSHRRREHDSDAAEFFVYTSGVEVPWDVTHVFVHPSVEFLPAGIFADRHRLKEVVLSEGLLEIGRGAFYECQSLEHLQFPSTLLAIGGFAFYLCISLRRLVFPEGLVVIFDYAFMGSSLEHIRLPSTLTTIGNSVFHRCSSLKVVRLADGIQTIGHSVFRHCRSLTDILLPATLAAIGRRSFGQCESLRAVELGGGILAMQEEVFEGCDLLGHVRVPSKALVVTETEAGGDRDARLVADGAIPRTALPQVVLASECFNSMRATEMSEFELASTEILGLRGAWDDARERLRALLAPFEVRHGREVTTLLELGLWKAALQASAETANASTRENCRLNCGAGVIIPNVASFL